VNALAEPFNELSLRKLVEAVYEKYGYDFRNYSEASLRRRLTTLSIRLGVPGFDALRVVLMERPSIFASHLPDFTVPTSEMFRDPNFYRSVRKNVIPLLRTYPTFKIWHAGCSTGEEVYSFAILLKEEGLYERALIYATDINERALRAARAGIYPAAAMQGYTANYQNAGGTKSFASYYQAAYDGVRFDPVLRSRVVFADHNLAVDSVFSEVHMIICRNVLIYFNRALQNRVMEIFTQSLRYKGFLCLGSKETVRFLDTSHAYTDVDANQKIFQKARIDNSNTFDVGYKDDAHQL
jgi:chemotaxis protein methyltransferase CheR